MKYKEQIEGYLVNILSMAPGPHAPTIQMTPEYFKAILFPPHDEELES